MRLRRRHPKLLKEVPREILRQVDAMLTSSGPERKTYDEISEWLAGQGHPVSISAIGRYARWMAALDSVKLAADQAQVLVEEAQSKGGLALEEATSKLAVVVAMEIFQEAMRGETLDVKVLGGLMGDFARLQSSSVQREKYKAQIKTKAEKAIENIAKKKSLDPETMRMIREEIYGIA